MMTERHMGSTAQSSKTRSSSGFVKTAAISLGSNSTLTSRSASAMTLMATSNQSTLTAFARNETKFIGSRKNRSTINKYITT